MRVLNPNGNRVINVALRDYSGDDTYDICLINENNGENLLFELIQLKAGIQANDNQFQFTVDGTYKEGDIYSFKILDNRSREVLHRGKIFFTSQTPQNYNINE